MATHVMALDVSDVDGTSDCLLRRTRATADAFDAHSNVHMRDIAANLCEAIEGLRRYLPFLEALREPGMRAARMCHSCLIAADEQGFSMMLLVCRYEPTALG